jgi:DNA-binding NarL/FixJ family response regulator
MITGLVAEACGELLKPEFEIIGIVPDGRTLLQIASQVATDLVLLDIGMPQLNGLEATTQLKQMHPSIKVIILTVTARPDVAAEAFRRGASGYVVKYCSSEELMVAVRRVLRGEKFLSPQINKDEVDFLLRSRSTFRHEKQLTAREREILRLLADGKAAKEIGDMLQIRIGTVFYHKYKMMEDLRLRTTAELIQYAIHHGVVPCTSGVSRVANSA